MSYCGFFLTLSQVDSLRGLKKIATMPAMTDRHQIAPYPVRLPPDLRAALEASASEAGRSLHGEVLLRLQRSFDASLTLDPQSSAALADLVAKLNLLGGLEQKVDGVIAELASYRKTQKRSDRK